MKKFIVLFIFICMSFSSDGYSQNVSEKNTEYNPAIGIWTAYSPFSSSIFAKMEKTKFTLLGISYTHSAFNLGRQRIYLKSEFTLFGRTDYPENGVSGQKDYRTGVGIVPARVSLPIGNRFNKGYPFTEIGLGIFLFEERFPNQEGTLLNITIDASIGYNFRLSEKNHFSISYRFHHLSNAGRGDVNPGIDSNMFVFRLNTRI